MAPKAGKRGGDVVFGIHTIIELLKAKRRKLFTIYTTRPEPKAWPQIARLLPSRPVIPIQYVAREVLHKLAGTTDHQGIVAYAQPFAIRKKFFEAKRHPLLLMVDGIQDTYNLGAILRSVYCTGFSGVIICQRHATSITGAVLKASAGLAEYLDVYCAPSPADAVRHLKEAGYTIYLTFFDGHNAATYAYEKPLCVVIGGEATGISRDIAGSGAHVSLPQRTPDISYNASVAAGIMLFVVATRTGALER